MPSRCLITGVELAKRLGVTLETVRQWRRSNLIPAVKINSTTIRYDAAEVIAVLKARSADTEGVPCEA